jgi:hypothetical protein
LSRLLSPICFFSQSTFYRICCVPTRIACMIHHGDTANLPEYSHQRGHFTAVAPRHQQRKSSDGTLIGNFLLFRVLFSFEPSLKSLGVHLNSCMFRQPIMKCMLSESNKNVEKVSLCARAVPYSPFFWLPVRTHSTCCSCTPWKTTSENFEVFFFEPFIFSHT